MKDRGSLLASAGVAAGLTYFLDPDRGARRRARIRDAAMHLACVTSRAAGTTGRDALHRTQGAAASLRTRLRPDEADDAVLVERVRAHLGRAVSHPHAIRVSVSHGGVTLHGPVLTREVPVLIRSVSRIRGVHDVVDRLERHDHAGNVPALQGGRPRAGAGPDILQNSWAPTTRCVVGTGGGALAVAGALRGDLQGVAAVMLGGALLGRAVANLPVRRLMGLGRRRRAVDVQKTITINAPVAEVYAFWSMHENFPRFMSRILRVTTSERDPQRSHWKVAGPAGVPVEFDAEIRKAVPNTWIAWRTLPGSPVAHAGIVRFDPEADGRTRVHIRMSYNPPAGWLGHGIAAAFGVDPKSSMDEDLLRMKTLIETGRLPHDARRAG